MGRFIADPCEALKAKSLCNYMNNIITESSGVRKIPTQIMRIFPARFQRQYLFSLV